MYTPSFFSLAFSSKLPMYSTNFVHIGLVSSIRDQSLLSSSSGAMGSTACGLAGAGFVVIGAHATVALYLR